MKFVSSCYWQQGENDATLLLQQCRLKKREVFFACICAGREEGSGPAADYLSKQLRAWFRGIGFARIQCKPGRFLARQAIKLERLIKRTDAELAQAGRPKAEHPAGTGRMEAETAPERAVFDGKIDLGGILCLGDECLIFGRGGVGIRLLNRSMGRPYVGSVLEWGNKLCIRQGRMEPGIGLLFATQSFLGSVSGDAVRQGLSVGEVLTERQAERHLQELGKIGETAGGTNMAAVLLLAWE